MELIEVLPTQSRVQKPTLLELHTTTGRGTRVRLFVGSGLTDERNRGSVGGGSGGGVVGGVDTGVGRHTMRRGACRATVPPTTGPDTVHTEPRPRRDRESGNRRRPVRGTAPTRRTLGRPAHPLCLLLTNRRQ